MKKLRILGLAVSIALFIASPGLAIVIDWNTFIGSTGSDTIECIVIDSAGNIFATGYSDATWGTPIRAFSGGDDAFLAKFDNNGVFQWNTFLGSSDDDQGKTVNIDPNGNIYVVGSSIGSWGTPINPHSEGGDAFVAKLNSSGIVLWNTFMGGLHSGDTTSETYGVDFDNSGKVYISGRSFCTWGTPISPFSAGMGDAFVAKLTNDGDIEWNTFLGSSADDYATGLIIDDNNNLYICGMSQTPGWGLPVNPHSGGYSDGFAAKLNNNGELQWNTFMGANSIEFDKSRGIALDVSGNVYVCGNGYGTWGSPISPFTGSGKNIFLEKLNNNGERQWNTFLGPGQAEKVETNNGGIYVVGYGTADWGNPAHPYSGGKDIALVKVNENGELIWNEFLGTIADDGGNGQVLDGSTAYIAGYSGATWENPINPFSGGSDGFLAKLSAEDDEDGPTAYYPFNGNANDESGNEYDGNVNGPSLTTDRFGNANSAYLFDGVDDYIDITSIAPKVNYQPVGTISLWFQADSSAVGNYWGSRLISFGADTLNFNLANITSGFSDESIMFSNGPPASTRTIGAYTNGHYFYYDDKWHHAVLVMGTDYNAIYVDGVKLDLDYENGGPTSGNNMWRAVTSDVAIGRMTCYPNLDPERHCPFKGKIDDIRIYTRDLSEEEILDLFDPVADFSADHTSGYKPLDVQFTDDSTGEITSWAWDFGDDQTSTEKNPGHTYQKAGKYTVELTVSGPGGSDSETKTDYITVTENAPVAGFSADHTSGYKPLDVQFTDESTGEITSWAWDFGDDQTSTEKNPEHTYQKAGKYTVKLTVTGPGGSDSETKTDYITVPENAPVAVFSADHTSGYKPLDVQFTDDSTGEITSWAWDFGDDQTSTEKNPGHTYQKAGKYTVKLTVTGPGGSDSETKTDYITVTENAPVAGFSADYTSGYKPLDVQFTDDSTGEITSWAWDFGDDQTSTEKNPGHTYQKAGKYTVKLTVTGPGGSDSETKTDYITVTENAPVAGFSADYTSGYKPLDVQFTDESTGEITSWTWDFGDEQTSTEKNPEHTYQNVGQYTVKLTVSGPSGSDGETKADYINVKAPGLMDCYDLDDNQVPDGWELVAVNNGDNYGIGDGVFWAKPTDSGAALENSDLLPDSAFQIKFSYDANIAYSYYGMYNRVGLELSGGGKYNVYDQMAKYNHGSRNRAVIVGPDGDIKEEFSDLEYTDYHYTVIFQEGLIQVKAVKISDGSELYNFSVRDSGLTLNGIKKIWFGVGATTDANVWMDNLCVEIRTEDGLAAYYPFNGNADDKSGNGYDGIVNGPSLTTDRQGNANSAYLFDGVDDFIDIDSIGPSVSNQPVGTISLWFKGDSSWVGQQWGGQLVGFGRDNTTFHLGNQTSGFSDESIIYNNQPATGKIYRVLCVYRKGHYYFYDDQWHHVVFVMGTDYNAMYIDGQKASLDYEYGDQFTGNTMWSEVTTSPSIGCRTVIGEKSVPFKGVIDDIRIYTRDLSELEISLLFDKKTKRSAPWMSILLSE